WDGEDEASSHFLALNAAGQPLGCARLLPSGQIGRMAVLREHRGGGLGTRLLQEAIEAAKRQGMPRVSLHAQIQAEGFYRKAGFLPLGEVFMEAGIPHREMELALPIPFEPPEVLSKPQLRDAPVATPTPTPGPQQHHGERECRQALLRCLDLPVRKLDIFAPQLDHALFDDADVVATVSRFARSSPSAQVRIIICDASAIVSRGHQLAELARRLESKVSIRKVVEELTPGANSFVTWDDVGFFLLPDFREYAAVVDGYDRVQAQRFSERFGYLWERSSPDPELRTLAV
ncbi:MAG: GNAT family N-acetyltransferase, partial [Pseudomonadales bacterium]